MVYLSVSWIVACRLFASLEASSLEEKLPTTMEENIQKATIHNIGIIIIMIIVDILSGFFFSLASASDSVASREFVLIEIEFIMLHGKCFSSFSFFVQQEKRENK